MTYTYEKYVCESDKIMETVAKYGVAIVPNVLNNDELMAMRNGAFETFEFITQQFEKPFNREDTSTWGELSKLLPLHSMLYQHHSLGHSQYVWDIRQNPKVVDIFASMYGTSDLLTSFDGISFHVPHEMTKKGYYRGNKWYHTDQTPLDSTFKCIQSWITAYDVDDGDATLAFLEGSNNYHWMLKDKFGIDEKSDWFKLPTEIYDFMVEKCEEKYIKCPAGSMVFWDSRTFHCGKEPDKKRKKPNFRNVVYVCMLPREGVSKAIIKKKQKALIEMRLSSHWPNKCKLFPKTPRTYGNALPQIEQLPPPKLTRLGMQLSGF